MLETCVCMWQRQLQGGWGGGGWHQVGGQVKGHVGWQQAPAAPAAPAPAAAAAGSMRLPLPVCAQLLKGSSSLAKAACLTEPLLR